MSAPIPVQADDILSEALAWGAPHTVTEICKTCDPSTVANLAHAIDRRVYMALREHDEQIARVIDNYVASARESLHRNSIGWLA